MKSITKIITATSLGITGALGVGIPLIVIETSKSNLGSDPKINLLSAGHNSVKFSVPSSAFKSLPVVNKDKKAKIILKTGNSEIIPESNFKVDKNKIEFTLFNLNPEIEYKLMKVEFSEDIQVDFSSSNTVIKIPKTTNSTTENPDQDNISSNEKSEQENTNPSSSEINEDNSGKIQSPDTVKGENQENKSLANAEKQGNINSKDNLDDQAKKSVQFAKIGFWRLNNFSPNNEERRKFIADIIRKINLDLVLLTGMSPAADKNIENLLNDLNSRTSENWGQFTTEKHSRNRRYSFLYKKSIFNLANESSTFSPLLTKTLHGFANKKFIAANNFSFEITSISLGTKSQSATSKVKKGRSKRQTSENQETSFFEQAKPADKFEKVKDELKKIGKKSLVFVTNLAENANTNDLSSTLSTYKVLLKNGDQSSIKSSSTNPSLESASNILLASKDLEFKNSSAEIVDIINDLKQNKKAATVVFSPPIVVELKLKN
ncbi:Uncharacterised protein [Mesomycoplasma dispar]|uniref:Uncharacterized protein n=1 Tax=Mesomycoplasma dispar TaxID=86660 RepID=A0AAJ5TCV1_9BACT|nr:hypothetical protein [Mesomycoplasma dispar]VEU61708.1 Uncharacterised protein [Mesomycoplasma dispar]